MCIRTPLQFLQRSSVHVSERNASQYQRGQIKGPLSPIKLHASNVLRSIGRGGEGGLLTHLCPPFQHLNFQQCKIESFSLRYKLFKISFLTTFISIKTLYDQICDKFIKSLNFSNLENVGNSWRENNASWMVDHEDQYCLK